MTGTREKFEHTDQLTPPKIFLQHRRTAAVGC